MQQTSLRILPEYDSFSRDDRRGSFVALVRPPDAPHKRPALRLVLALDTSGSMNGDKIATALASAQAVVQALSADDTFAFVVFSGRAQVLLPPTPMNAHGKQIASQQIASARARGNTNMSDAVIACFELTRGEGHALLLTDGCPTEGVTNPDQLLQLARGAARGATLSAFGFGRDVNPLLLSSLAEVTRGNYTFIDAGEPPVQAIAAEVGGQLLKTAASFSLDVHTSPGASILETLRASDVSLDDGVLQLSLPALIAGEEVALPFTLSWSEENMGRDVASLSLRAYDVASGQPIALHASLCPSFGGQRGRLVPAAAREILLGRAAVALRSASKNEARSGRELALAMAELRGELTGYARAATIEEDPQVKAALQMLLDAQQGLEAMGQAAHQARQDMVATSASLSRKRATMMGLKSPEKKASQAAFFSRSQLAGIDFITGSQPQKNDDND